MLTMAVALMLGAYSLANSIAVAQTAAPIQDSATPTTGNATPAVSSESTAPSPDPSHTSSPTEASARGLRIASWNLNDAAGAGVITRTKRKRKTWRNTFVPRQRRQSGHGNLTATLAGADIVLMQGVNNIREARKLFPARYWKLIISRQILKTSRRRGPFPRIMPEGFATTAIAVRYQLGVRVTGQEHLLALGNVAKAVAPSGDTPRTDTPSGTDDNSADDDAKPSPAPATLPQAGLAVRVLYHGRMVWLVSVALGDSCVPDKDCASHATLKDWITDKRDYDDKVILAGHFRQQAANAPIVPNPAQTAPGASKAPDPKGDAKELSSPTEVTTPTCARQDIRLVGGSNEKVKRVNEAGCIAIVTLHK